MTSITWKKAKERERIMAYFQKYTRSLSFDVLRDLTLWLVLKLVASLTLSRLVTWRENLEKRAANGETYLPPYDEPRRRCTVCGTTDHHVDREGNIVENPTRGQCAPVVEQATLPLDKLVAGSA